MEETAKNKKGRGKKEDGTKTPIARTYADGELIETYKGYKLKHRYLTEADLEKASASLYHFSSKAINSNANQILILLSRKEGLQLPYVGVRILIGRQLPMQFGSVNQGSTTISGINTLFLKSLNGQKVDFDLQWQINRTKKDIDKKEKEDKKGERSENKNKEKFVCSVGSTFHTYVERIRRLDYPYLLTDGPIDARLRQILIPFEEGYRVIVPLFSTPFSTLAKERAYFIFSQINNARETLKEQEQDLTENEKQNLEHTLRKRMESIDFPLGGINPFNIDIELKKGHRLICAGFYRPNRRVSQRFSIRHLGLSGRFYLDRELLTRYADFIAVSGWEGHTEAQHKGWIKSLFRDLLARAEVLASVLEIEDLEGLNSLERGWLDPFSRDPKWARKAGEELIWSIIGTNIGTKEEPRYVQANPSLLRRWALRAIHEELIR